MGSSTVAAHIDARVLAGLGAELRALGEDPEALGEAAGIARTAWARPDGVMALDRFVALLETAGDRSRDAGFVWRCGRRTVEANLAGMFPAAGGPVALGDALRLIVLTLNLLQTDSVFGFHVDGGLATIEYRVLDPSIWPRGRDVEFTFGFLDGVVRRYAGGDFRPAGLAFEHEPHRRAGRIDAAVGIACVYGGPTNVLALPAGMLSLRPHAATADADPAAALAALAEALVARDAALDLTGRVRRAVYALVGSGGLDQAAVAAACGLTERTLRRRLADAGLSFRAEVERLKVAYAREAIARTTLPLGEIAWRLGYAEQSSFSRAFRRATGTAPIALRRAAEPSAARLS